MLAHKRNSRQENSSKRGRESSFMRQSQMNKPIIRPGSSHLGRVNIPDSVTPPCCTNSTKKSKRENFKINSSQGFNNDFWQWNMLENLSSSRGNRSSKLDNVSGIGSSVNTQKNRHKAYPKNSRTKNSSKDRYKRENRC